VDDRYGVEVPDADDVATMVAELTTRLDRSTIARALGIRPEEVDVIGAGYVPEPEVVERLRLLYRVSESADDLRDPKALLAALGVDADSEAALPFALLPRLKTYLVAFLVADAAVLVGIVVAFVLLR